MSFAGTWDQNARCVRSEADRQLLRRLAGTDGGPIVALQHYLLHPFISEDKCPYMITNYDQIVRDYAQARVLLSISGHDHDGHPAEKPGGVWYVTCPSLGESPFRYLLVTLTGREVEVEEHRLLLDDSPPLVDYHRHTEFAYGAEEDFTAEGVVRRSRLVGLAGLFLTEHAPQLYCSREEFMNARHIHEPDVWRAGRHARMDSFLEAMRRLRSSYVRLGLEVELDALGRLTLLDEHRGDFDVVVGSVHWLPEDHAGMSDGELAAAFLRANDRILAEGVDILAHPLRLPARSMASVPREIYPRLADALARTNTAAEINLHLPLPDTAFIAECIDRGGEDFVWHRCPRAAQGGRVARAPAPASAGGGPV